MKCPECGSESAIYRSLRERAGVKSRRHECRNCKTRFVTQEIIVRKILGPTKRGRPTKGAKGYTYAPLVRLEPDGENAETAQCASKHWVALR